MNIVLQFLKENWSRLGLKSLGSQPYLSCLLVTPKFRASNHVLFFIFADGDSKPILIAKVPRLAGPPESLDKEAENLREILVYRSEGFDSIPRVIAYEEFRGNHILIENALAGQTMNLSLVRQKDKNFIEAVMAWLIEFHTATQELSQNHKNWYDRLIERPWNQFAGIMPLISEEQRLVDAARNLTSGLEHKDIVLVFEHRDLGHPNILLRRQGTIGVVDWELAEPRGLPVVDLFFFLALVGFGRHTVKTINDYLAAFHSAFFGPNAWAKPYIARYALKLKVSPKILKELFVLCWSRYLINMAKRLIGNGDSKIALCDESARWLRANRYYALWQYTIRHYEELNLAE